MQYQGSKVKFAKQMLKQILPYRRDGQWWVEPFCGSCSVTQYVSGNRIVSDSNYYLIEMRKALQNGWIPPDNISEHEYIRIKQAKENYAPELVAFVGFGCSFGGKWFDGYAKNLRNENYAKQARNSLIKRIENLSGAQYYCCDYKELEMPPNSLIYCDPPYAKTTRYYKSFDHNSFWSWVRQKCRDGHLVFVSEYNASLDFESIWDYERNSSMDKKSYNNTYTEKLFVWKGM